LAKSDEIWCLPLEIKKATFFDENFKIGGPSLPFRRPCSHYCIHVIWWVYDIDATIGVMLNMLFFLLCVWSCENTYSVMS